MTPENCGKHVGNKCDVQHIFLGIIKRSIKNKYKFIGLLLLLYKLSKTDIRHFSTNIQHKLRIKK